MDWWECVKALVQSVVGFDFVDETTEKGNDWLRTAPAKPPAQPGKMRARRMWPFGIRARPPRGVEAAWVAPMAAATSRIYVAAESNAFGPLDLKEGEVCIYNSVDTQGAVCRIRLDVDGNIVILPKASARIRLGDGTDANLDQVVLKQELNDILKDIHDVFNDHTHSPSPTLVAGMTPVTGPPGSIAAPDTGFSGQLVVSASPNVFAKK
jgi:hypothetical protein